MTLRLISARDYAVSLIAALSFAAVMISAAVPVVPVA